MECAVLAPGHFEAGILEKWKRLKTYTCLVRVYKLSLNNKLFVGYTENKYLDKIREKNKPILTYAFVFSVHSAYKNIFL